jgi:hypothetical protein
VTKHHPEDKVRHLLAYIGLLLEELRMQNWDVILHTTIFDGEDAEDTFAHTWQSENHCTTNIEFGPDFLEQSPSIITNTLVHELIHVQHRDVTLVWEGCMLHNDDVPKSQAHAYDGDFRMHMERFVSWITHRIAPTVPQYQPGHRYKARPGCYIFGEQPA